MKSSHSNKIIFCNDFLYKSFLFLILLFGILVRVFNLDKFLGFYFDQGRDALIIWDFLKSGKFFLIGPTIGPTMGVGDVPRGPWYLWILIPFYWLGRGDPIFPAYFLVFSQVLSLVLLYFISYKVSGRSVALLSFVISIFSFNLILSSHWLSNPTLMYLLSVIFLWSLFKVSEGKVGAFLISGFLSGLSMHFGGSADMFYPLIVFVIAFIWARKLLGFRNIISFIFLYITPFLPQIIFDFRHNGVIRKGLWQFINSSRSFSFSFWDLLVSRVYFYLDTFSEVVWGQKSFLFILFFLAVLVFVLFRSDEFKKNKYFQIVFLSLIIPFLGMLFLRGEKGVIYGYYFTGFYLFWVLFFSFILGFISKSFVGKVAVFLFLVLFLGRNLYLVFEYFRYDYRKYNPVILQDQLLAIDWIYKDAGSCNFNVDVYVPPVVPYAYDYLFKWYGEKNYGCLPLEGQTRLLYTLSEADDSHPNRFKDWVARQDSIGKVEQKAVFGNIFVERRIRI